MSLVTRLKAAYKGFTVNRLPGQELHGFDHPSRTGISVTEDSALHSVAVWACVRILSETLASLPLILYRRLSKGKERATDHPLYKLLHTQPNPEMTSFTLRETLMAHLVTWGNAYALIDWENYTTPLAIWPMRPDMVQVKRVDNKIVYRYTLLGQGQTAELPSYRVLHIPGLGFDGLIGYSPIHMAREAIGLAMATEEFGARFFGNNAQPGLALKHPAKLTNEAAERLKKSWEEAHQGLSNAHKIAILEEGMDITKIGIPPEDAQFLQTRKFQRNEIASFFHIPPHMIGDLERATFCLPADVEVYSEFGPVSVANISVNYKVWSLDDKNHWVLSKVVQSKCTGQDKIIKIKTTNRTIRTNSKHRIYVRRKCSSPLKGRGGYQHSEWSNEWVSAGNLKIGDTIISLKKLPDCNNVLTPTRKATVGFMEFCGLYLGDGNKTTNHISIAHAENAQYFNHYRDIITNEFLCNDGGNGKVNSHPPLKSVHLSEGKRYTRFSSVLASKELSLLGFDGTAHTKEVPKWIFGLSDELKLAFLRGFLDADGSVDKNGRISFSSCNKRMLSQIRHLCISLAIPVTNLRYQSGNTKLPNGECIEIKQYSFTCSNPKDNQKIGSNDDKYNERLTKAKPFNKKGRKYPRFGGNNFNINECELSRIVSIEYEPAEDVYDLEVEGTHSFIANGVVVHNSNIEQQSLEFVIYTMRPWLVRWEQAINTKLILPNQQDYFAEFLVDGLLRGDTISRYQSYATGRQWGWLSANDIRELENLNPIPGGEAYFMPLNMYPMGSSPVEDTEDQGKSEIKAIKQGAAARMNTAKRMSGLFEAAGRRIVQKEKAGILKGIDEHLKQKAVVDFQKWLDTFYEEFSAYIKKTIAGPVQEYIDAIMPLAAAEVQATTDKLPDMTSFVRKYAEIFARDYIWSSKGQLQQITNVNEDSATAIMDRLDEWEEKRPGKIAKNESIACSNAIAKAVFVAAGIMKLMWVAQGRTSCPLCQELDGQIVGSEGRFGVSGLSPKGHPPIHEGCECQIVPTR